MVAVVTGHHGFLGQYVCNWLRAEGWEVVGAGRPEIEILSSQFDEFLRRTSPELIVHCAGPASVPSSLADPTADLEGSATVLANVLEGVSELSHSARVILISSAAVYGQPNRLPVDETTPIAPISPYGFNRVATELVLREFYELYDVPGVVLRVFSAYGEGLRRQILWDICKQALSDGAVRLFGTGSESRDFVHASDVAAAIALVARHGAFSGETYNVASGTETTIRELADLLVEEIGGGASVSFSGTPRAGDPLNWKADIGKIEALGFRPTLGIEEGARAYARWVKEQMSSG
ncbi:MAG: NAD-dependent epimerase/dehydratase family protein [Chloroflexi bacterium]|nr:NAD-dependent epimerase/dehydratase family protein [Chloroflexota bacterium]